MIPAITPPLLHTAVVERDSAIGESPSRQRLPAKWAVHDAALACNYWVPQNLPLREGMAGLREGPNVVVVATGPRLLVRRSADVGVGDRIAEVRFGDQVIAAGPIAIVEDLWRRTHRELGLELPAGKVPPAEAS